ncbi:hypothetical protein A7985_23370 [Pseudoalteromonas luteoviolacea]|uniref:Carrier domain-containing protein n=1 Tax=Pseudoalteromonas luteoviolacea TaxID=43657 RepID=A0A1C0TJW0_9GAMM|nr:non-ribosomal peptide synthetase [Pseudoalteromonas luteoviolacea]OCQ18712.1 hypothetical protein A7985_23370 [Pseudoalteromonas luteoviolacea]
MVAATLSKLTEAKTVIRQLMLAGVELKYQDGRLTTTSEKDAVTPEIARLITGNKQLLVDFLVENPVKTSHFQKIEAVSRVKQSSFELSFAQQRLWFIEQMQGASAQYNIPLFLSVEGQLDLRIAEQALQHIVSRHEPLRTRFINTEQGARQVIEQDVQFKLHTLDLRDLEAAEQQQKLQALCYEESNKTFNLSQDLMIRARYIKLGDQQGTLLVSMHHIASDGWSMQVLYKEFTALYRDLSAGKTPSMPQLAVHYVDYASWQKQWLEGPNFSQQLKWWETQLDGAPLVNSLPLDKPRPEHKQYLGGCVNGVLDSATAQRLQALTKTYKLTPFMLIHAALSLVLTANNNSEPVLIGTPLANRNRVELEQMIGFFVNTVVLKTDIAKLDSQLTIEQFFEYIRTLHMQVQANQDVPFEMLVNALQVPRSKAHTPLFQVMLTTNSDYGIEQSASSINDVHFDLLDTTHLEAARFDLEVKVSISEHGVSTHWIYDRALFEQQTIERFDSQLSVLLSHLSNLSLADKTQRVSTLPLLSEHARHELLEQLNDTDAPTKHHQTFPEFFEAQVAQSPNSTALQLGQQEVSYAQLNSQVNRLANLLRQRHHVQADELISVCLPRSIELISSVLAILKAGGAYVPFDAKHPAAFIANQINKVKPKLVITTSAQVTLLQNEMTDAFYQPEWLILDAQQCQDALSRSEAHNPPRIMDSSNLAYVLTTSGSTGEPKLIGMPHRPLVNLIMAMGIDCPSLAQPNSILQFSSIGFDMSFADIGIALLYGGKLTLLLEHEIFDASKLSDKIIASDCSVLNLPYAMLQTLANYSNEKGITYPEIRVILSTAERLVVTNDIKMFFKRHNRACLVNQYGPTETHVCTSYTMGKDPSQWQTLPPIGHPIANGKCYVLDEELNLVPKGAAGELYVGGVGLAQGYLGNKELTLTRFIDAPEHIHNSEKLYRTGDIVRWRNDNELEYLDRADNQIKIRGFRVELGAIDQELQNVSFVQDACTAYMPQKQRLISFVTIANAELLDSESTNELVYKIRAHLGDKLPYYMVPSAIKVMDRLPLNTNGKVDRKALLSVPVDQFNEDFVAPKEGLQLELAKIWGSLLGLEPARININAPFFDIGGHSLLVMRLIYMIEEKWGVELEVGNLFDNATIKKQSVLLEEELLIRERLSQQSIDSDEEESWEI